MALTGGFQEDKLISVKTPFLLGEIGEITPAEKKKEKKVGIQNRKGGLFKTKKSDGHSRLHGVLTVDTLGVPGRSKPRGGVAKGKEPGEDVRGFIVSRQLHADRGRPRLNRGSSRRDRGRGG